jgi:ubiquinone/menaquinone biosynthesis C-methylase UbiE
MFSETADIETASEDYANRFSGAAGSFFLDKQTQIVRQLLADLPRARVLDVGGGHAQLAGPLAQSGYEVTVTGSSESCRARLDRSLAPGDFTYRTCDNLNLPFSDRSFDIVLSFRLLPHVTQWQKLLAEMCRVADKCVILDYPDLRSTNILYEYLFSMKKKMEGNTRTFTLFSRQQIRRTMIDKGFGNIDFRPEFFLPMVVHRKVNNRSFSSVSETICRMIGLTTLFGSPIIFRANRLV